MRYYFDIFDGDHCARDERGIDCFDDMAARRQAVLSLVEMARDYIPADGASMALTVRVRRAAEVAFTVRLDFSTEAGPGLVDPRVLREHREVAYQPHRAVHAPNTAGPAPRPGSPAGTANRTTQIGL